MGPGESEESRLTRRPTQRPSVFGASLGGHHWRFGDKDQSGLSPEHTSSNPVSRDLDIRASPIPVDTVYGGPARTRTASVGCTQGCSAGWQIAGTDLRRVTSPGIVTGSPERMPSPFGPATTPELPGAGPMRRNACEHLCSQTSDDGVRRAVVLARGGSVIRAAETPTGPLA